MAAAQPDIRRFNGAATFRSRKAAAGTGVCSCGMMLQWGRDLSVAEGPLLQQRRPQQRPASMGPRPFGRGRQVAPRHKRHTPPSFNGAATFRSRKDHTGPVPLPPRRASMGPRPFGRGRLNTSASAAPRCARFNGAATFRSRKESDADMMAGEKASFNGAATFRSRKEHDPAPIPLCRAASMGPRPFGRGR